MAPIFTLEDIKEFLLEQGLNWSMQIYDIQIGNTRPALIEDFNLSSYRSHISLLFKHGCKDVYITNFQFLTYIEESNILGSGSTAYVDKTLSQQWQEFLLNKHQEKYAKILFDWSIEKISQIQTETERKIAEFTNNEHAKAKPKIEKFNSIANKAIQYLSSEELEDVVGIEDIY